MGQFAPHSQRNPVEKKALLALFGGFGTGFGPPGPPQTPIWGGRTPRNPLFGGVYPPKWPFWGVSGQKWPKITVFGTF